jgi:molecular chaperone GrpE (heat shock protein)
MSRQLRDEYESESVIPFAAKDGAAPDNADQLDKAGQTILQLLHKAAGVAEANSKHAVDMAQKLSHQLRAAEDRIAELKAEVGNHRERADRAEQWLHKVYTEIEDRFLPQDDGRRGVTGPPQRRQGVKTAR